MGKVLPVGKNVKQKKGKKIMHELLGGRREEKDVISRGETRGKDCVESKE